MNDDLPSFREDDISQIPALMLLQNLGYTYLTPAEAETLRGGRLNTVLLSGILEEQLRKINKIRFKGAEYEFSEGNIQAAIQAISDIPIDGLVRTNEKVFDLLTLGKSLPQTILGDTKSFPLNYIDWNDLENNVLPRDRQSSERRADCEPPDPTARHRPVRERHPVRRDRVQAAGPRRQ